jgi:uncharacterized protein involved in exopolysaccharide biosynthesis
VTDFQEKLASMPTVRSAGNQELDFLDYLRVLWCHRWMIVLLCLGAMGLAVGLSLRQPRQYQATVTVVPPLDTLQKQAGGLGGLNNSFVRQMIDTTADGISSMYVEILQSREVADVIIDRFHLMEVYEGVRNRTEARRQLQNNTKIETADSGAVKVNVLDLDPNRAAAIANAYIEELDKQNKRLSAGEATSKRIFLENRLKEVEAKLSKIDNILSREAKIQETLYELLVQQYEFAKIDEVKSMPTIQVLDPAVVPETGVGRGTVKKGILAGIAAFMGATFLAFGREYVAQVRRRKRPAATHTPEAPAPVSV